MIPGELWTPDGEIEINVGRHLIQVRVANSGDRPIQVGSHYHFFETNDALQFDRKAARGFRLNIPAGTAVRFEPGQSRDVELVSLAGLRKVYGFAGRIMGALDQPRAHAANARAPTKKATIKQGTTKQGTTKQSVASTAASTKNRVLSKKSRSAA